MTERTHIDDRAGAGTGPSAGGWGWLVAIGIVLIAGGILGLVNPFIATLTATGIAAGAFMAGGVLQLVAASRDTAEDRANRWLSGGLGVLLIAFGVTLFIDPLAGIVSLTLMVAVLFLALGGARAYLAVRMRSREGWGWLLASGVVSAVLGVFILLSLPEAAGAVLGIVLSVELLASGSGLLGLAVARWRQS